MDCKSCVSENKEPNFMKGSIKEALCKGDWSNLTAEEIAEVLCTEKEYIIYAVYDIKKRTGFVVKYKKCRPGRKRKGE